jgi:type IX secretion system PorP/SprF family membrane protein
MALRLSAQDPQFSQFDANPLYMNPAATGEVDGWRMGVNYRNQWLRVPGKTFPGPLSTYDAYADFQLRNLVVGGLGFNLMQDMEGEGRLKYTTAGFFYSWHTPTGTENFNLFFGTRLSYNFLTIDYSRLTFSDQLDPELGPILPTMFQPGQQGNVQYFDIDAGIKMQANITDWWSTEIGFSAAHLVRPDVSLSGIETLLPMKLTLHTNQSFAVVDDKFYLVPKYLFQAQDQFKMHVFGTTLYVTNMQYIWNRKVYTKPVYIGMFYRSRKFAPQNHTNSFIFTLGNTGLMGKNNWQYQVGVSYDVDIKGLTFQPGGSLELSFTVVIPTEATNILNQRKRWKLCPGFKGNPLGPL